MQRLGISTLTDRADRTAPVCLTKLEFSEVERMESIKPIKQPCVICNKHKANAPFFIRDNNGKLFKVSHIAHCPYCGRFLKENYSF